MIKNQKSVSTPQRFRKSAPGPTSTTHVYISYITRMSRVTRRLPCIRSVSLPEPMDSAEIGAFHCIVEKVEFRLYRPQPTAGLSIRHSVGTSTQAKLAGVILPAAERDRSADRLSGYPTGHPR